MKPLDLKIEHLRSLGFGAEERNGWLYIWAQVLVARTWPTHTHVLMLPGNPTYRRINEGLRKHFRRSGAGGPHG